MTACENEEYAPTFGLPVNVGTNDGKNGEALFMDACNASAHSQLSA